MLNRDSFGLRFLGLICGLTFFASFLLGMALSSPADYALDLTRTAICCGNQTTEAMIIATQRNIFIQTEVAKIQVTQTFTANTITTIEAKSHPSN